MFLTELENLELENGGLTPTNSAVLLANYLVDEDLLNAKFLWKRTTIGSKKENDEIGAIWALGKKLWAKDFQGFFFLVKQRQWSEAVGSVLTLLVNKTRQRVFRLISLAYTFMRVSDFVAMIDLPSEEAIRLATNSDNGPECRWTHDAASQMLEKTPTTTTTNGDASGAATTDNFDQHQRQFQLLTDYVSFLENY